MSSVQLVVYGVLWVALMMLAGLLLLLYRQVERVYAESYSDRNIPLGVGVEAPEIEIIDDDGVEVPFDFPAHPQLSLVTFLMPSCSSCLEVAGALAGERIFDGPSYGVVLGEDNGEFAKSGSFRPVWASHPPDVMRAYGVGQTPFAYVLRGRTVLAAKYVDSRKAIDGLVQEALENESGLEERAAAAEPAVAG